jgi:hypothetical protein
MNELNSALLNLTRLALLALMTLTPGMVHADGGAVDTMNLTDEPGNWFRSEITGTPFTAIRAGQRVDFKINNCCTSTRHTVTLLMKPAGSRVVLDQDSSQNGTLSATFDVPGVYLFHCKIHPYMTAVVGVKNAAGNIPDVTAGMLPFIGHLGVQFTSCDHRSLGYHNDRSHRRRQACKVGYSKFNSASEAEDSRHRRGLGRHPVRAGS